MTEICRQTATPAGQPRNCRIGRTAVITAEHAAPGGTLRDGIG